MIQSVFMANSTYSLLIYALTRTDKLDSTLFVCGPALKNIPVQNKVQSAFSGNKPRQKLYARALTNKINYYAQQQNQEDKKIPLHLNMALPVSPFMLSQYKDFEGIHVISDGLSDSNFFKQYQNDVRIQDFTGTQNNQPDGLSGSRFNFVNLETLWNQKTEAEKQKIAALYQIDENSFKQLSQKEVVLITQPLSEDGIVSEEDKIRLYKAIVSQYDTDKVVIKPHPREKTDWSKIFPEVPVIKQSVAAELLSLIVPIKKVATFYSTAAFSMTKNENQVDIYSKNFGGLTFSHPGQNMGRVPYLDIEKAYGDHGFNWKRIPDNYFYRAITTAQEKTR